MEERKIFSEIPNIEEITQVLGLIFPESATEFQRAALTLAHMMATLRDCVLKGHDISKNLIDIIHDLADLISQEHGKQR